MPLPLSLCLSFSLYVSSAFPRFISLYKLSHVDAVAEDEGDGEEERRRIYQFGLIFKMQFYAMKIYPHLFYFFFHSPSSSSVSLSSPFAHSTLFIQRISLVGKLFGIKCAFVTDYESRSSEFRLILMKKNAVAIATLNNVTK